MSGIQTRSRGSTYALLIGVVVGVLAAGLGVPLIFADPVSDQTASASGPLTPRTSVPAASSPQSTDAAVPPAGVSPAASMAVGSGAAATVSVTSPVPPVDTACLDRQGTAASDHGITGHTLTLGIAIYDLAGVSALGFAIPGAEPETQRRIWDALIEDANQRGGICGRRVVGEFRAVDPTSEDSMRAACLYFTQEKKVFAVLDTAAAIWNDPIRCVTIENKTPFLSIGGLGFPTPVFEGSNGFLLTAQQSGERSLANMVFELHNQGVLRDRRIGILDDDRPGDPETVDRGAAATLESLGYEVTERGTFSGDAGVAASQVPVMVQQMSSAGVDLIVMATGPVNLSAFTQTAEQQQYRPLYVGSDWYATALDSYAQNMPPSFDGALAVTSTRSGEIKSGLPETPAQVACREAYERVTGEKVNRETDGSKPSFIGGDCGLLGLVRLAVERVDGPLNRPAFVDAALTIQNFDFPSTAPGSFGQTKFSLADEVRTLRYAVACECYQVVDALHASQY
jgi:ABC-type branched-subunit amino acid transport system substrate-binding protein